MYEQSLGGHGGVDGRAEGHEETGVTRNEGDVHNKEDDGGE